MFTVTIIHGVSLLYLIMPCLAANANDWRTRSIYQLVTDRFAVSSDTGPACDAAAQRYCGGSWQGIINHLDYIQNMGFDAVWISPVVANLVGNTPDGEGYHGYWTQDFNSINSNFGTTEDLMNLSNALHARQMYLMFDVVVNHMATTGVPPSFSGLSPFSVQSDFHPFCLIQDYNNQTDVEQCWLGDNSVPLPDINTEDQDIVSSLNSWIQKLVQQYQVDGLRIDTVKHVRKEFWPNFASSAGVFTLGEVLDDDTSYTAAYTRVLDGVLDYPTYFPLFRAFSSTSGNLSALVDTVVGAQTMYKNGAIGSGSFVENHDQPRLQSMTSDQSLVMNAMTWPFVQDSIPILYYGQEQGYTGGAVPNNREALWFTAYETDKPLVKHVKALNAARKQAIAADNNFISTPLKFIPQPNSAMVVVSKPPLFALLTNVGNSSAASWTVPDGTFKKNQQLVDVLNCTKVQATAKGGMSVQASNGLPQVLLLESAWNKSTLCPSLTASGATINMKISWLSIGAAFVSGLMTV